MAAGGGGGNQWIKFLLIGGALVGGAYGLEHAEAGPTWAKAALFAIGGLLVVFGSCEAMIISVEGLGERLGWNAFVAGTMAGLASNIPEVVMLGFVLLAKPRVGFIVVALTLHVGAMTFGTYSAFLPRDDTGHARLPAPLVKLSTDLFAAAGCTYLATGLLMLAMRAFSAGEHAGEGLSSLDLFILGGALLMVEVVAVRQLIARFSADEAAANADEETIEETTSAAMGGSASLPPPEPNSPPGWGKIVGFGLLGIATSVVGGDAVGDFADILVEGLNEAGYSEMVGALAISLFACAGPFIMIGTAHAKGMHDIALANASGAVNQVPFVVQPIALIMLGAFAQFGMIPLTASGAALPIDLETTAVILLSFPPMLMLWKAVQDDGKVNWVETASMVAVFALILYFLAQHG